LLLNLLLPLPLSRRLLPLNFRRQHIGRHTKIVGVSIDKLGRPDGVQRLRTFELRHLTDELDYAVLWLRTEQLLRLR